MTRRVPVSFFFLVALLISSCQKENFTQASWYTGDIFSWGQVQTAMDTVSNNDYISLISDRKLLKIANSQEFEEFAALFHLATFDNVQLPNSSLAAINFDEYNIYVLSVYHASVFPDEVIGESVKIVERDQQIEWALKLKTHASGNSISQFQRFYYLKVPKENENYEITGIIYLDERATSFGAGAKDKEWHYSE